MDKDVVFLKCKMMENCKESSFSQMGGKKCPGISGTWLPVTQQHLTLLNLDMLKRHTSQMHICTCCPWFSLFVIIPGRKHKVLTHFTIQFIQEVPEW